jgi:hypothetical protein
MGLVYVHWTTLPKGLKIVNVDVDNIEIGKVSNIRFLVLCVSFFDCGGLAVGECLSHKIAEAATMATCTKFWAAAALSSSESSIHGCF